MSAYYNEHDPFVAQWLRNLIARGVIAPGDVDERDIRDVRPDDLFGYAQCHFFAGIGVWSFALRLAGWPDDRPVWTGSCPCQPFSAAGKGAGFADERHLWPAWFHLIEQRRPPVFFGEQVASKDGLEWIDLVQDDAQGAGYAIGPQDRCSAGSGAPHIRQRLHFVAHADGVLGGQGRAFGRGSDHRGDAVAWLGSGGSGSIVQLADTTSEGSFSRAHRGICCQQEGAGARDAEPQRYGSVGGMEHPDQRGRRGQGLSAGPAHRQAESGLARSGQARQLGNPGGAGLAVGSFADVGRGNLWDQGAPLAPHGLSGGVADPHSNGGGGGAGELHQAEAGGWSGQHAVRSEPSGDAGTLAHAHQSVPGGRDLQRGGEFSRAACHSANRPGDDGYAGPTDGFWRAADWLLCRDGKWRPVEPGTFPLADGVAARVGLLRAYGNAINPWPARDFIADFLEYERACA